MASSKALYEGWSETVKHNRGEFALAELATGRSWTFDRLAAAVEALDRCGASILHPRGHDAGFVLEVLRGWRDGAVLCPLEPGQPPPHVPSPPTSCAHLKLTSATTTGVARCVRMTAEQLAADARNIVRTMGLRPDWPNLGVISLSHSYGFSNLITPLLLHGIPLLLAPAPLPEALRLAARRGAALTLPAVPALWRAWHEADAIPSNVQLAISAGAPLPLSLERAVFDARGLKIHNFYGASECGGIAFDRGTVPREEGAYAGTPLDQVEVSLAPEGTLVVRGGNVADGYWPQQDPALDNGRFQTPDLADIREDGVWLRGRVSDVVNVAGRKVHPETIEACLLRHPGVRNCLAFGVPASGQERGEELVAVVVADLRTAEQELRRHLLEHLPAWQVPRHWWTVESLAANRRGKISRAEWRQRFLELHATEPTNAG